MLKQYLNSFAEDVLVENAPGDGDVMDGGKDDRESIYNVI